MGSKKNRKQDDTKLVCCYCSNLSMSSFGCQLVPGLATDRDFETKDKQGGGSFKLLYKKTPDRLVFLRRRDGLQKYEFSLVLIVVR